TDDVADLFFLDGRQLDEACQTALARNANGDDVRADVVARQELFHRLARELVGVGIGLAEDLGVLDVIEGGSGNLAADVFQTNGFESALPQVNAPNAGRCYGHS